MISYLLLSILSGSVETDYTLYKNSRVVASAVADCCADLAEFAFIALGSVYRT